MLVGILNGTFQNPVNLQSINLINTTIGIVIVGIQIYDKPKTPFAWERLENYP